MHSAKKKIQMLQLSAYLLPLPNQYYCLEIFDETTVFRYLRETLAKKRLGRIVGWWRLLLPSICLYFSIQRLDENLKNAEELLELAKT